LIPRACCKTGALPVEPQPTVFSLSILSTYRFLDSLFVLFRTTVVKT